jgi:hypothetical protein
MQIRGKIAQQILKKYLQHSTLYCLPPPRYEPFDIEPIKSLDNKKLVFKVLNLVKFVM